jgi:hypothetical protein
VLRPIPARKSALLAAVVGVQLMDLVTCIPAVARVGIDAESNPIARALYVSYGAAGPALLKLMSTAILVLALLLIARRFPTRLLPAALVPAALGFAGFASNVVFGLARQG